MRTAASHAYAYALSLAIMCAALEYEAHKSSQYETWQRTSKLD